MRRALTTVLAAGVIVAALAASAAAYPHYQLSSDSARCADCHLAPAGGGLLSEWGRGELGDTLSAGGDGRLLHGIDTPAWLALGGDLRLAALVHDTGADTGAETAVFPMQLELAARVGGERFSATAVVGLRSVARDDGRGEDGRTVAPFSREHFVTAAFGDAWQVRAGRFAPPFGLRLADHTAYVRRFTGGGLYEEPYAVGASHVGDSSDLHVTAFVADPLQARAPFAAGLAVLYERRAGSRAVRGSGRISAGEHARRGLAGVSATWWLPGPAVVVLAEVDAGWEMFPDAGEGRPTATAYVGPTWLPERWLAVTAAAEFHAADLRLPEANRYAGSASIAAMPWAHVEVQATGRYQRIGGEGHAATAMLQLHYIL